MKLWFYALSLCLGLSLVSALPARAYCFDAAGARYQIDPRLLRAIAEQESGLKPTAINVNRDNNGKIVSHDYGIMQVNSKHIPVLVHMGVLSSKDDLLNNPCLNIQIGAWILAKHLQVCGVSWRCLGTYNAGFNDTEIQEQRRMKYARLIYSRYLRILGGHA